MEQVNKLEKEHRLLARICKELEDASMPVRIDTEEIPGTDKKLEICRMLTEDPDWDYDPPLAEFYFLDTELSAPGLLYFTGMITLYEDVRLAEKYDVMEMITLMNANLPYGAFNLNMKTGVLTYRLDAIYNANESDDNIYPHLTATAASLLTGSRMFASIILDVCAGDLSIYEAREQMGL